MEYATAGLRRPRGVGGRRDRLMAFWRRTGLLSGGTATRGASAAELRLWIAQAVAIACLVSIVPALILAMPQVLSLHPLWLAVVGGGIVGFSLLMPVYAWSLADVRWLCGAYAVVTLIGLATWSLAWTGEVPATSAPWLWVCVSIATLCAAMATNVAFGFGYAVVAAASFGIVRWTPQGGMESVQAAAHDVLALLVLPAALLLLIMFFTEAVEELDTTTVESQRVDADRALDRALGQQRTMLDTIIHDRVMTTLVAAVQTDQPRVEVAELARTALDALAEAGAAADTGQPLTVDQFSRLIEDMVESVCPQARVLVDPGSATLLIDPDVASALGQAAREAALNVTRHAEAEEVTINVSSRLDGGEHRVRVDVHDNGRGFDPDAVPDGRFGIRLSLIERMTGIGGEAQITSKLGNGTLVSLRWNKQREPVVDEIRPRVTEVIRPILRPQLFKLLVWLVVGMQSLVGILSSQYMGERWWEIYVSVALGLSATGLALFAAGKQRLSVWHAIGVVLSLAAMTQLVYRVQSIEPPPTFSTWYGSVVMVVLITLLVRNRRLLAWLGLMLFIGQTTWWVVQNDLNPTVALQVSFGPLLWMVLATLVLRGLASITEQVAAVRSHSRENTQAMAENFSKLVLREVWLTQLRDQVGPLLQTLADPTRQLTEKERDDCRVLEGRLRDSLRAGNLVSQGVSDAIQEARARGVEVILVDNRGSRLPEPVRLETLRQLEQLVRNSTGGRIVARTAPEGYAEAVTILRVDAERNFTTIDESGTVTVRKT